MSRRPPEVLSTVDLPSGKILEVVQPERGAPFTRVRPAPADEDRDLCICEHCASDLVEPVDWASAGTERWRVALSCPNCGYWTEGVFSQECVDRFDDRLDEGIEAMIADLKRLAQANMADDIELFVNALRLGGILPEDF